MRILLIVNYLLENFTSRNSWECFFQQHKLAADPSWLCSSQQWHVFQQVINHMHRFMSSCKMLNVRIWENVFLLLVIKQNFTYLAPPPDHDCCCRVWSGQLWPSCSDIGHLRRKKTGQLCQKPSYAAQFPDARWYETIWGGRWGSDCFNKWGPNWKAAFSLVCDTNCGDQLGVSISQLPCDHWEVECVW